MARGYTVRYALFTMILMTGLGSGAVSAAPCAISDVSLTIDGTVYSPSACRDGISNGGGPGAETGSLNTAFGTSFVYLDKSDDAGTPVGLGGVTFAVTAQHNQNLGSWTVTWNESPGLPNLPLVIDFIVGLFGGNVGAGYLFEDVLLPVSPNAGTGTFDINFTNNGGQQPALSHLVLAGGNTTTTRQVPEPASVALVATMLIALALVRRRRTVA
jgi:hypothetical protein